MPESSPASSPTPATPPRPADSLQPLAALLGLLLPGAGHFFLGHRRRALLITLAILGLFFGGLFIGGIDAVDSRENRIWFYGQALVGPTAFLVDAIHQDRFKVLGPHFKDLDANPPTKSIAPSDHYADIYETQRPGFHLRAAYPYEIRDPATGVAVIVRDPRLAPTDTAAPLRFTDPLTHQERLSTPADRPPYVQALGRASELGTLFATIAGMLNLICIIDVAYHHRRRPDED